MSQIEDARNWLSDSVSQPDNEEVAIDRLSESAIWRLIDSHYAGGVLQFARDGLVDTHDGLPLGLAVETPPKVWVATIADAIQYGTEFAERHGFGGEIEPDNDGTEQTNAVLAQDPPSNVLRISPMGTL